MRKMQILFVFKIKIPFVVDYALENPGYSPIMTRDNVYIVPIVASVAKFHPSLALVQGVFFVLLDVVVNGLATSLVRENAFRFVIDDKLDNSSCARTKKSRKTRRKQEVLFDASAFGGVNGFSDTAGEKRSKGSRSEKCSKQIS
ncbi:hypothetical protein TcasGA2_TC008980 [Tribolium castaneum]|uniref:Uncharacterized protein n=1 Tax=Tribolium castaneum TaxID=7070 RepID=D6WQ30_TRICA|nr:hypothetical protein TcasGA2_TC008980 [Tribolium castaneum]